MGRLGGSENTVGVLIDTEANTKGSEQAANSLDKVDGASRKAGDGATFLTGAAKMAGTAVVALGVGVAVAGAAAIKGAGEFEQNRVAFDVMLGSADKARALMTEISDFAKSTPFELPEVIAGSKQLLAFGFAQEQIIPTMRKLGDIAAGVGVPVGQLAYVFGQVRVAGKLMGGDLMQFTNAGVPMIEGLSKVLKVSQGDVKKMVEEGKVGFKEVEQVINNMTKEGSQFGGMMEKQSGTFDGVVSNIKDGFGQMLRSAVGVSNAGDIVKGGLFDRIKAGAQSVLPMVAQIAEGIGPVMMQVLGAFDMGVNGVRAFFAALSGEGITSDGFVGAMEQIGVLVRDVAGTVWAFLAPSFAMLAETINNQLIPAAVSFWNFIQPALLPTLQFLATVLGGAIVGGIWLLVNALNVVIGVFSFLLGNVKNVVDGIVAGFNIVVGAIGWLKDHFFEAVGFIIGFFMSLPIKIPMLVIAAVGAAVQWLMNINWGNVLAGIGRGFASVWDGVKNAAIGAFNYMANINWGDLLAKVAKGVGNSIVGLLEGAINGALSGIPGVPKINLPRFEKGVRNFSGGYAIVGERGPEIVNLPRGSDVFSNGESRNMVASSQTPGKNITFNNTYNVYGQTDVEQAQIEQGWAIANA